MVQERSACAILAGDWWQTACDGAGWCAGCADASLVPWSAAHGRYRGRFFWNLLVVFGSLAWVLCHVRHVELQFGGVQQ